MPIYSYRCETCGHQQDILQKMSDPLLTVCPACGASAFRKQVTAAGFQLKGSGWYVTDFRESKGAPKPEAGAPAATTGEAPGKSPATAETPAKTADAAPAKSEAPASKPSAPPASGTS